MSKRVTKPRTRNVQPVSKRGKTGDRCQARETRVRQVTIGFGVHPDWLKKQHVCSDWLEHAGRILSHAVGPS